MLNGFHETLPIHAVSLGAGSEMCRERRMLEIMVILIRVIYQKSIWKKLIQEGM